MDVNGNLFFDWDVPFAGLTAETITKFGSLLSNLVGEMKLAFVSYKLNRSLNARTLLVRIVVITHRGTIHNLFQGGGTRTKRTFLDVRNGIKHSGKSEKSCI